MKKFTASKTFWILIGIGIFLILLLENVFLFLMGVFDKT